MGDNDSSSSGWPGGPPPAEAFHVERVVDPCSGQKAIGSIRHPAQAWRARLPAGALPQDRSAQWSLGRRYLAELAAALQLVPGRRGWLHPELWRRLARPRVDGDPGFGWLELTWSGAPGKTQATQPLGSFWVACDEAGDRGWLVLLAGNVVTEHQLQFGADLGLRIVMQVDGDSVRIHGVTLSGLSGDRALRVVPDDVTGLLAKDGLDPIKRAIELALDGSGRVWIHDIERSLAPDAAADWLSVSGVAAPPRGHRDGSQVAAALSRSRIHDFRVELSRPRDGRAPRVVHIHRNDYLGAAARARTLVRSFITDAAAQGDARTISERRPWREQTTLEPFRRSLDLFLEQRSGSGTLLRFGDTDPWFETGSARRSDPAAGLLATVGSESGVVKVSRQALPAPQDGPPGAAALPELMSDEQGSIECHARASELFARLHAYKMVPEAYFRFARLPLVQRARPAMLWAPDGELPNAEVRPFLDGDFRERKVRISDPPQLLVRYGSASPFHRHKLPAAEAPGRSKAQYLSIASDPRWAWHEFGHVLAFASTGELEFPFAHSAGDALAAIAADPRSSFADDPESPQRFVTFPWIEVPGRSHGQPAWRGWCWCGARNLLRLDFDAPQERYHHSYFGEQLMSSSLFRLYRSLGGDTCGRADDLLTRLEASDYCIYLVMRAISLLGPDGVAPARSADQFVAALIDADLGTGKWEVEAAWPFDLDPRTLLRTGGRVHKVIRWAFERQGLYATSDPRATAEGPGQPPKVDLFIADQRPTGGPDGGPGAYVPVPLRSNGNAAQPWHAHPQWLCRDGSDLTVWVGNRGRVAAHQPSVRGWWRKTGASAWTALGGAVPAAGAGPSGAVAGFGWQLPAAAARDSLWILVSADSPADPSNLPANPKLPRQAEDLLELVAHDNNLALARL